MQFPFPKKEEAGMRTLKQPYLKIQTKSETSYGGNQKWFSQKFLQKSACGVIGAADVLLHLSGRETMTEAEYMEFAKMLWKRYLPVIPGFGMNGLTLMLGMNRYFRKHRLPYLAYWCISRKKMISRMDEMLERDIPIIFAVGPNFPKIWGKKAVKLYRKNKTGEYVTASKVRAHYMIVTGRDGRWIRVSSWGKEYYIDYSEFLAYVKEDSCAVISNIICIKALKKIK